MKVRRGVSLVLCVFQAHLVTSFVQTSLYAVREPVLTKTSSHLAMVGAPEPAVVRGICFDMDGTLTDSDELHYVAYRDTILERVPDFNGGAPLQRSMYNEWMSGNSNPEITQRLFPHMPMDEQENLWEVKEALYRDISTKLKPLAGLSDFLKHCDELGVATIIVTNAPRIDAMHTMEVLGIHDRFAKNIVIGFECTRAKPHPDPYLEGIRRLDLPADSCIAFEDSLNGVKSAVAAGLYTVGVLTTQTEKSLTSAGASVAIHAFDAEKLKNLLLKGR